MNKDLKNLLIVGAITVVLVFLAIPKTKSKKLNEDGFMMPSVAPITENETANATVALKAVRAAINNNETKSGIDELKLQILKEYNIRVSTSNGLLYATDRSGKAISNEQL